MMLWKRLLSKNLAKRVGVSKFRRKKDCVQNFLGNSLAIDRVVEGSQRKRRVVEGSQRKRKTIQVSTDSDLLRVKKQKTMEKIGVKEGDDAVDRISELPDHIVHNIFSLLQCPKDVARTSVLSKKWKRMFDIYPSFDFDERYFRVTRGRGKHNRIKAREMQKKNFKNCVEKSLASRLKLVSCIQKFRLDVDNLNGKLNPYMQSWLTLAVRKNVKEVEIHVNRKKHHYLIPDVVLMSTSITSLKLSGCLLLFAFASVKLCNLRELSIKKTLVNEDLIKKFEQSCPLIEDLRLVHCRALVRLHITALDKLRRVEVHECGILGSVEIEASNLETFCYYGQTGEPCLFNLTGCPNLKHLTLRATEMTDEEFHNCISKLPLIEKLFLKECHTLQKITILSGNLKSLGIIQCMILEEVIIDTPSLSSFKYSGNGQTSFPSINIPGLHEAKFQFVPSTKAYYISELHKFFQSFDQLKDFKLIMHSKQNMTICEEPTLVHLVRHIDQKLELTTSANGVLRNVNGWLQSRHRKRLTLVSCSAEVLKCIHTMIMNREENPHCCKYYSQKCWRHHLAGVRVSGTSKKSNKIIYEFKWSSAPLSGFLEA